MLDNRMKVLYLSFNLLVYFNSVGWVADEMQVIL